MMTLRPFLSGLLTAGFLIAGLFFLRFWSRSRDVLFLAFSCAFALLAANQAALGLAGILEEERSWLYLLRFVAFLLIALAIFHKNRAGGRR